MIHHRLENCLTYVLLIQTQQKPRPFLQICPECGDRATEAQARMLEDLLEGRPVVDHDLPKKRDLVDLGDSDDEEVAVTDTSSGKKKPYTVGQSCMQFCLNANMYIFKLGQVIRPKPEV